MACIPVNGNCGSRSHPRSCCGRISACAIAAASPHRCHHLRSRLPPIIVSCSREKRSSSFKSPRHLSRGTCSAPGHPQNARLSRVETLKRRSLARNIKSSDDENAELSEQGSSDTSAWNSISPPGCNRRDLVFWGTATAVAAVATATASKTFASEESLEVASIVQEENAAAAEAPAPPASSSSFSSSPSTLTPEPKDSSAGKDAPASVKPTTGSDKVDTTITDKVYMDVTLCPSAARSDRGVGKNSQLCSIGEPLGRIVIGLYGRLVPQTVKNFKAMMTGAAGSTYVGTIFHRVLAGQYIQGGRQGSREKGEVSGLLKLTRNQETVAAKSYKLTHTRPGTVSLALAANDDDEEMKLDVDYHNVQFLITTGPGPAPQLDNGNIVIGTVMEGLDVVAAIAKVPTYQPNERIRQFNEFASFLGDERAANARNFWDRPLKTVVISDCGVLQIGFPVFPPGLP